MQRVLMSVPKNGLTPLKLEHIFLFLLGLGLVCFGGDLHHDLPPVGQIIILIVYLGLLVGIAPLPMPVLRSKFRQVVFAGFISGFLDSFIVLVQCQRLRTVEEGQSSEDIMHQSENQPTEGVRAKFLALLMISALIGGLIIWFGEVYAAGLYLNDGRTGVFSALYIVPPVVIFLSILGFHANRLPINVVRNHATKFTMRDFAEFAFGIAGLLYCHNPMLCLGWLLIYAVLTRQDEQLLSVWKHHTEVNVMLVLLIALVAGPWLVAQVITPLGLDSGTLAPIVPAGIQAVLWGPLYEDPEVHFWMRLTTLSTGALLLPISSLVGVMLFKSFKQWFVYVRYSFLYAGLWYIIMRAWIYLTLESPVGHFLDQFAHNGGTSH